MGEVKGAHGVGDVGSSKDLAPNDNKVKPQAAGSAAIAAAERAKRIAKNRKIGNEIMENGRAYEESSAKIVMALEMLDGYSGEQAEVIRKELRGALEDIETEANYYNVQLAIINANLRNDGVNDSFEGIQVKKEAETKKEYNSTFSCDTGTLRAALSLLDNASTNLNNISIIDGNDTIQRTEGTDSAQKSLADARESLENQIYATEQAEKENEGIINKVLGWIGIENKEEPKEETTRMEMISELREKNQLPNSIINDTQNKQLINLLVEQNDIDTTGKNTEQIVEEVEIKLLAKEYDVDTEGKTNDEIVRDIAEKAEVNITKTEYRQQKFEMPYFNQQLYEERWICCAACTAAEIASWGSGITVDPHEFETTIPYLKNAYVKDKGTGNAFLWKLDCWDQYNVEYYNGEPGDSSNRMNNQDLDQVVQILKDGGIVAMLAGPRDEKGNGNIFTEGGHYLTLHGVVEDENGTRLLFYDPDGDKYTPYGETTEYGKTGRGKEFYMEYLESGVPIEVLEKQYHMSYYGFKKKEENYSAATIEEITTNKTTEELLDEIKGNAKGKSSTGDFIQTLDSIDFSYTDINNKNSNTTKAENETTSSAKKSDQKAKDKVDTEVVQATEKSEEPDNVDIPQVTLPQTGVLDRSPIYDQNDYLEPYAGGTVADNGCGITCVAEYLTKTSIRRVAPNVLAEEFNDPKFNNQEKMLNALDAHGVERGEWNNGGDKVPMVLEALKNGKSVLVQMNGNSNFTNSGHFMIFEGMTDDGKILVYDPNASGKTNKNKNKDGYVTGFDWDYVKKGLGGGCVLEQNING